MKVIYKSESKIPKHIANNTPKEIIEKQFIINFFKNLPVDKLKILIDFKEIDFENKKLWLETHEDDFFFNKLMRLREENCIEYNCEIAL